MTITDADVSWYPPSEKAASMSIAELRACFDAHVPQPEMEPLPEAPKANDPSMLQEYFVVLGLRDFLFKKRETADIVAKAISNENALLLRRDDSERKDCCDPNGLCNVPDHYPTVYPVKHLPPHVAAEQDSKYRAYKAAYERNMEKSKRYSSAWTYFFAFAMHSSLVENPK
jgi:hypothetical protein